MAQTAEGKELTEANRVAQLAISSRAMAASKILWDGIDVARIDRSVERWLPAQLALLRKFHNDSNRTAATYLNEYRLAEIGQPAEVVPATFAAAKMRDAMLLAGPVRTKLLIGKGMNPDEAKLKTFPKLSGIVRRQVLDGGRGSVVNTESGDSRAIGWRRVTDGNPCTFCAMLAARGPKYFSAERTQGNVLRPSRQGDMRLLYHGHCGCTSEIVYGEWTPTKTEQSYINAYDAAAKEADKAGESRTADTILHRMRANGAFNDSPKIRTAE
ncbi:VG15 protein [Arthrobacter sp. D2-10]